MRDGEAPKPYTLRAERLQNVISRLEGWVFGRWLRFTTIDAVLHISMDKGWEEVANFNRVPGLREFADDLNAAMQPVIDAYALKLRQELANECIEVAAKAMSKSK